MDNIKFRFLGYTYLVVVGMIGIKKLRYSSGSSFYLKKFPSSGFLVKNKSPPQALCAGLWIANWWIRCRHPVFSMHGTLWGSYQEPWPKVLNIAAKVYVNNTSACIIKLTGWKTNYDKKTIPYNTVWYEICSVLGCIILWYECYSRIFPDVLFLDVLSQLIYNFLFFFPGFFYFQVKANFIQSLI